MHPGLGPSVRRVHEALTAAGGGHTVVALEQPARTSAEAARAVGCRVDQIAKSLVFRGEQTQRAVLVIASGANRVDERKVAGSSPSPWRGPTPTSCGPGRVSRSGALLRSRTPSR